MIEFKNITKSFGGRKVLKNLDFEFPDGLATGIVGPNGSGKTTMIKTLLGLVKPDSGKILIDDKIINSTCEYRRKIGYMSQIARYPENMTVQELIDFIKEIRTDDQTMDEELIQYFGLQTELGKRMRMLSGGTKQKVSAVLAMIFNAQILIFDEPTAGLDPQSSIKFKNLIQAQKEAHKTILLTTHIMSEIEELADNIIFIVEGEVQYNGPIKDLLNTHETHRLEGAVAKMMEELAA